MVPVDSPLQLKQVETYGRQNQVLVWNDGTVTVQQIRFFPFYDENDGNKRTIRHSINELATFADTAKRDSSEDHCTRNG